MGTGLALVVIAAAAAMGCAPRVGSPHLMVPTSTVRDAPATPRTRHWPLAARDLHQRLVWDDFAIESFEDAGAGVTGAKRLSLKFWDGPTVQVKWKTAPFELVDGWNNSPRKEIAAYAIQEWFLEPPDWVVPPTALRCIPLEIYREHDPSARETIPGTECVLGTFSLWLSNVEVPERLYDEEEFWRDPLYAYHLANFNLLTYLTHHRDSRTGNVLVSTDTRNRRVFAVDNGIAFDTTLYNFFVRNWSRIRVPALPVSSIEALRRVRRRDVDALGVLVELRVDGLGLLRPMEPGPNLDPERGARVDPLGIVQLGLTKDERDDLWDRLRTLLRNVSSEPPVQTTSR